MVRLVRPPKFAGVHGDRWTVRLGVSVDVRCPAWRARICPCRRSRRGRPRQARRRCSCRSRGRSRRRKLPGLSGQQGARPHRDARNPYRCVWEKNGPSGAARWGLLEVVSLGHQDTGQQYSRLSCLQDAHSGVRFSGRAALANHRLAGCVADFPAGCPDPKGPIRGRQRSKTMDASISQDDRCDACFGKRTQTIMKPPRPLGQPIDLAATHLPSLQWHRV